MVVGVPLFCVDHVPGWTARTLTIVAWRACAMICCATKTASLRSDSAASGGPAHPMLSVMLGLARGCFQGRLIRLRPRVQTGQCLKPPPVRGASVKFKCRVDHVPCLVCPVNNVALHLHRT